MNTLELNSAKTLKIVIKESNKSARIQCIKKKHHQKCRSWGGLSIYLYKMYHLFMCVYIYIYIYICEYVYIYTHTYT